MMFDVQEHVERYSVLDLIPQRSGDVIGAVAVVVHRPHREKRGQTLPHRHRADLIPERVAIQDPEYQDDPRYIQEQLGNDGRAQFLIAMPKCGDMQEDGKDRTEQHGAPSRHVCVPAFHVVFAECGFVVSQVVELHGVHRSQHDEAHDP
jgi:hypothetical protein